MYPPRNRSPCLPHASLLNIPWLSHSGQLSANTGTAAGTTFSYEINPVPSLPKSKYILGWLDHKILNRAAPSWHKRVKLLVFLPVLFKLSHAYKLPGGFVKCRFWFCGSGARFCISQVIEFCLGCTLIIIALEHLGLSELSVRPGIYPILETLFLFSFFAPQPTRPSCLLPPTIK